jgi:hypothetical protein
MSHQLQEEVVNPGLIQDDVREFRNAVFNILNDPAADDVLGLCRVWLPKTGFIDPVRFL